MKKVIIIVVSLILVLTTVLAGTALAAKPEGTPMEEWDMISGIQDILNDCCTSINTTVNNIMTMVTGIDSDIRDVDDKIVELGNNVTDLAYDVANIESNTAKIESGSCEIEYFDNGCSTGDPPIIHTFVVNKDYTFEEVRHVKLIFKIPDWTEMEYFSIDAEYFEDDWYSVYDTYHYDYGPYRIEMYEFDAMAFNIFQVLEYGECECEPPPPLCMTYMFTY